MVKLQTNWSKLQYFLRSYYKHLIACFVRDIWDKYHSWYFKIAPNFTRLRLVTLCITILKYHSWYLSQILLQTMLLPILIHPQNMYYYLSSTVFIAIFLFSTCLLVGRLVFLVRFIVHFYISHLVPSLIQYRTTPGFGFIDGKYEGESLDLLL